MGAENEDGFDWENFWSVLRYAYKYTDEELKSHSYRYLFTMYAKYYDRACENLGVPRNKEKTESKQETKETQADNEIFVSGEKREKLLEKYKSL